MSFADLERNSTQIQRTGPPGLSRLGAATVGEGNQHAFRAKNQHISQQVFRISSNVSSIQRLVADLGTSKDSQEVRTKLQDLTEQTRNLVRDTSQDIKDLAGLDTPGKKLEQQKVSKDFQKVLVEFQKVQRVSAEKQREFVFKARQVGSSGGQQYSDDEGDESGDQPLIHDDQRRMQLLVVDNELEYNESMIAQREDEIRQIESGITELNEIFRDLGTMVHEQGSMLDSIENNVTSISMTTHAAAEELTVAAKHQKNATNKSCYLLMIAAIVAGVVILAIL